MSKALPSETDVFTRRLPHTRYTWCPSLSQFSRTYNVRNSTPFPSVVSNYNVQEKFNCCQYVDTPTRKMNTLDLCYGNITDAYVSQAHPPLSFASGLQARSTKKVSSFCFWSTSRYWYVRNLRHTAPGSGWRMPLHSCKDVLPAQTGTFMMVSWRKVSVSSHITLSSQSYQPRPSRDFQTLKPGSLNTSNSEWRKTKRPSRARIGSHSKANWQIKNYITKAKLKYKDKLEQAFSTMNTK